MANAHTFIVESLSDGFRAHLRFTWRQALAQAGIPYRHADHHLGGFVDFLEKEVRNQRGLRATVTNLQQAFGPADEGPAVVFTKDIAETVVNGTYKFLLNLQQQLVHLVKRNLKRRFRKQKQMPPKLLLKLQSPIPFPKQLQLLRASI